MEKVTLAQVLSNAPGVELEGNTYTTGAGHHLSFYIGQSGQAMVLTDILRVELHDGFVRLERKKADGILYFDLSAVHGVAIRPPEERAGFE